MNALRYRGRCRRIWQVRAVRPKASKGKKAQCQRPYSRPHDLVAAGDHYDKGCAALVSKLIFSKDAKAVGSRYGLQSNTVVAIKFGPERGYMDLEVLLNDFTAADSGIRSPPAAAPLHFIQEASTNEVGPTGASATPFDQ